MAAADASTRRPPFERLARAAERMAAGASLSETLELLAEAASSSTAAELAVVRVLDDPTGMLVARATAPAASPRAAELSGSRLAPGAAAEPGWTLVPAGVEGRVVGAIDLLGELDEDDLSVAELLAAQLVLALQGERGADDRLGALRRAGEALAAGAELPRAARQALSEAAQATGAREAIVWRPDGDGLRPAAREGAWDEAALRRARTLALEARGAWQALVLDVDAVDGSAVVTICLGEPVVAVLQLRYDREPPEADLDALAEFGARVAHAFRLGARASELELELERTRALLAVVGEAIARLSLAHTLETAVDRIAELLGLDRVAIHLREERQLRTVAARGLEREHEDVAHALLELAEGPLRARETIELSRSGSDPALREARAMLEQAGLRAALAVPLRAHDETIGLLVAYSADRRSVVADRTLLAALASQLAVAVQNARLHEEATQLGEALGSVLEAERQAARRLSALYEISDTFTRSLSLERTLEAVTEAIVRVLGVDAAVIRVPDDRGESLVAAAVHVADDRLSGAVRTILERPQPHAHLTRPLVLDRESALRLGGANALLVPFLEKGSSAVLIPISTQVELLAQLTILSLDPANPISEDTVATATTIGAQAALALDNARLYQQQKAFAETIQRALLPGARPELAGLEVGAVYESAARLDVGGDVYDFLELDDGRVAVVLGDVTGHGVDATADMAMAKFVFRSLAREHPEPSDFLAYANEVVTDEIVSGKFITMAYLALGPDGRYAAASAGHPPPLLVHPDGVVEALDCGGLALGIASGQSYDRAEGVLEPGAAVVLYTDGVVEARSGGELYGVERLGECLAQRSGLPAQTLAGAVLADCRAFAGGELQDDCAVVVARRR